MTRERWLSLDLQEDALPTFEAGGLQTVEAAGNRIVSVPKHGAGHHLLGTAGSREEAVVIATILPGATHETILAVQCLIFALQPVLQVVTLPALQPNFALAGER